MRRQIQQVVAKAIKSQWDLDFEPEIEWAGGEFGDFSTNAPFKLAQQLKQPPKEIAEQLAAGIKDPMVESAAPAGPGYVNLTLTASAWAKELSKISAEYGKSALGEGKKVQVEFISANPTGPLTLANGRGGYLGDVLANVLAWTGYQVTREYYVNDSGNQIEALINSLKGESDDYRGEYIKELAERLGDDKDKPGKVVETVLKYYIKPAIGKMGIKFDAWFRESGLAGEQLESALEQLQSLGLTYEREGALWLKSTDLGDERDRVLRKADGSFTYLAHDFTYHLDIFTKRGFHRAIKVWGADHAGQVNSLRLTVKKLLPEAELEFIILQFVRLVRSGKEVKMSKRAGTYVTIDELIAEVGSDVVRWFFLMRSADTHLDFDLELAKEESAANPLWYVMYSYVRAQSILAQASKKGLQPTPNSYKVRPYRDQGRSASRSDLLERQLVRQMSRWPELISEIAQDYQAHKLTFFGQELARVLHDYYESERIIDLPQEEAQGKLYLVQQYATFLQVYFQIIGIKPLSKM